MKKLLSLLLAAAMLLSMCAIASADEVTTKTAVGSYSASKPYPMTFSYIEFYPQDASERNAVVAALNEYLIPNYSRQDRYGSAADQRV